MSDIPIQLSTADGQYLGRLRDGALSLIAAAESAAHARNLSKRSALGVTLRECLAAAGFEAEAGALAGAAETLDAVRRGQKMARIDVEVSPVGEAGGGNGAGEGTRANRAKKMTPMKGSKTDQVVNFFELERQYPDDASRAWYDRLVGLDRQKNEE